MINSKKIESEDEDDKFFQHQVLPTEDSSNTKKNDTNKNYTYPSMPPSMPPNMPNQVPNQQQYQPQNNQNNNIQFQKPNYNYNPQGYNPGQYNQMPQYNRPPNFSAPYGQNNFDQPLRPHMYNSFGMQPNTRNSMPQQPNFQADVSLHDFTRKHSQQQNNNPFNNRPF